MVGKDYMLMTMDGGKGKYNENLKDLQLFLIQFIDDLANIYSQVPPWDPEDEEREVGRDQGTGGGDEEAQVAILIF